VHVVRVTPGELHKCSAAAAAQDGATQHSTSVRCELGVGVYRDHLEHVGSTAGGVPIEIVGAGTTQTVMEGTVPVRGVQWINYHTTNKSHIYTASLPPSLQIPNIQQAFVDGEWISEARYPDTSLHRLFEETSWGFCGKGTYHGFCEDRFVIVFC
jgi:hypothetical protein